MANHTTNLNLNKPTAEELAQVSLLNDNMDILDQTIGGTDMGTEATDITGAIAEHQEIIEKINPTNVGSEGQILRNDGNGGCEWEDAANAQEIADAVDTWLTDNVPSGVTIAIDNSLTIADAAAGSKAVGDKLAVIGAATLISGSNYKLSF